MAARDDLDSISSFPPVENCWFLTGPTASGKTQIALELAEQLDAEIISMDSMALYLEMNIGTAKPTAADRQRVPHHLVDVLSPDSEFSVAQYLAVAHDAIQRIRCAGKQVLFVGGTPLYLKTLLRGVYQGPAADWSFRQEVEEEARRVGNEALHRRLEQVDPLSAAKLHPNDKRRVIRALEVYRTTGQPLSHRHVHFEEGQSADACKAFALAWPRDQLHRRIEERVENMFSCEFVEEVQGLLDRYGQLSRTASQAVGYREVIEHLSGEFDLEMTIQRVMARTRQFARRQETWFRKLSEIRRIPLSGDHSPLDVAGLIRQTIQAP